MSRMIEMKTADLIGPALDWAVAKACGFKLRHQARDGHRAGGYHAVGDAYGYIWTDTEPDGCPGSPYCWSPSRCWKDGGPLRDKYRVSIDPCASGNVISRCSSDGEHPFVIGMPMMVGSDALVAICRAVVAARLGHTVSVPAELVGGEK